MLRHCLAHAHAHLAAHKCPREIVFTDTLPRTVNGKVKRSDLIQRPLASLAAKKRAMADTDVAR